MRAAGAALAAVVRSGDVVTLSGPLGVGKTTLVRGFLQARGFSGEVPSPTFAIVQPYEMLDPAVWHVDLYRLQDPAEVEELGLDEAAAGIILVEWPSHGSADAWPDALRLDLKFEDGGARGLTAEVPSGWEGRWPPR